MRGRYQTRPVPAVRRPAAPPRVVRAEPSGALVTSGPLRGRRVAALTGYQLEDLRDWTDAQIAQFRRDSQATEHLKQLEAQARAVQDERERRWAELVAP